ncbi:hypothetical protein FHT28_007146 [Rhizobium sp. SG570]|nr:hypothetical protein [Rhizobium sp. SG570]
MATDGSSPTIGNAATKAEIVSLASNLRIISCSSLDMFARLIDIFITREFVEEFALGVGGSRTWSA